MGNQRRWVLSFLFVFGIIALLPISESSPSHLNFFKKVKSVADAVGEAVAKAGAEALGASSFKVRGTNLGGWLLIEGWIKPELFNAVPNKEFLDGTTIQFKSVKTQKNLCANSGGGDFIVTSCDEACQFDHFRLWRITDNTFRFRVPKNQFVGLAETAVVAVVTNDTESAIFEIIRESKDSKLVRIKASNGYYLQARDDNSVTADVKTVSGWGSSDPTVFSITFVEVNMHVYIEGDFQLQNGLGSKAAQIMQEHYDTFIVEHDFELMSKYGINAVRIPLGWWTAYDPNPPFPFVSGTLKALDNAFIWAKRHGIKIILDLHAAPGSQNGVAHSATRDGSLEWGKTYDNIQQTLEVIEFFAKRYGQHESLYGIELLNEPLYPYVTLESIENYARAAHKIIRKYNPIVYMILSARLSFVDLDVPSPMELFPIANSLDHTVVDLHWYTLMPFPTSQENIDYIKTNRTHQMTQLLSDNGETLVYIGEWSCTWSAENPTTQDLKEFAKAQIEVYSRASFGWSFWTWKNALNDWSLKWLLENDIIDVNQIKY
ncbi:putative glucan 1,3-beta-glucosidase A [Senna tora]|uniref:Putative glucan 1,3-beta-glucosidase A n=1 Tax=Senna tora TaxID=362788 RepID=A0A834T7N1_9FABA|nr:putative glucan 1,3-beta-glucosidase A [Senna tora]